MDLLYPYTSDALTAYTAAQTAVGIAYTALAVGRPLKPRLANVLVLASVWIAAIEPVWIDLFTAFGGHTTTTTWLTLLRAATAIATLAMLLVRARLPMVPIAFAGGYALWRFDEWVRDANWELGATHLVWFVLLYALARRFENRAPPKRYPLPTTARPKTDAVIFVCATSAAILASTFILYRQSGSGDEFADTFEADLFAHFKAFGAVPPCTQTFQSFWVFFWQGRSFAQYTPGWPLVMAPFQRVGVPWLAAPFVLGWTAVGVARLSRRAASGSAFAEPVTARTIDVAGILGAIGATAGASALLLGASRYPHTMVCGCFAWSIESLAAIVSPDTPANRKGRRGLMLGSCAAMMLLARPGDGATLGTGLFLYFVYSLIRRRIPLTAFAMTTLGFVFWAGLGAILLRLQLGVWFKTGYSITETFHPWAKPVFVAAQPHELKHVVPLGTGAYMWWPAAPALGVAGLLSVRANGRGIAFMLMFGCLVMLGLYFDSGFLHSAATGYGPRFHLPLVVPMAVGGAALLAPICAEGLRRVNVRRALFAGGPLALVVFAFAYGIARTAPSIYPWVRKDLTAKTAPLRAIEDAHLHHAVVTFTRRETDFDPMDLVQNYATDPNPDVILLHDFGGEPIQCAKNLFKDRAWYHAAGKDEATIKPIAH